MFDSCVIALAGTRGDLAFSKRFIGRYGAVIRVETHTSPRYMKDCQRSLSIKCLVPLHV